MTWGAPARADDLYVERAMLAEKIRHASFVVTISGYNLLARTGRFLSSLGETGRACPC